MEEKKETEEKLEEQKKEPKQNILQDIPPAFLIGGFIILVLVLKGSSGSTSSIWIVIAVIVLWLLLSQNKKPIEKILSPKEAELLIERELERKQRWGQINPMATYRVEVVGDLMHRDARGTYYNYYVTIKQPWGGIQHYCAKVGAAGEERGFVTFIKRYSELNGRDIQQETDITHVPKWVNNASKHNVLQKFWGFGR